MTTRDSAAATEPSDGGTTAASSRAKLIIPCATVFASSFCVMVIELVAGRIIAGTLGSSLYTWTSVIGIVLAGLAIGNYVGGRLADRFDARQTLAVLFISSSAAALTISISDDIAGGLRSLWELSWPMRVATHVGLVFFIPSCLLGTISPVAAKMALDVGAATGRTIGSVYAWGVVGSILGTFATGFYLVAMFGTTTITVGVATVLALLAVFYQVSSWKAWSWMAGVLVLALLMTDSAEATRGLAQSLGLLPTPEPGLIYQNESRYSKIRVYDSVTIPGQRELHLDSLLHSKVEMSDPLALNYRYNKVFAAVTSRLRGAGTAINSLTVGGGGYIFPQYLESVFPGGRTDVIEIDPQVTRVAKMFFGLPEDTRIRSFHEDARVFVNRTVRKADGASTAGFYDAIYVDAFNHHSVPFQLTTRAFTQRVRALLKPDGVFMTHLVDTFREGRFLGATINTVKAEFPHVYVFVEEFPVRQFPRMRNTFVVAGLSQPLDVSELNGECTMECRIFLLTENELAWLADRAEGLVLSDEFAPVENLLADVTAGESLDEEMGELLESIRAAVERGDPDAALAMAESALVKIPDEPRLALDRADLLTEMGRTLFGSGRVDEARQRFETALRLESSAVRARIGLIDCYRAADRLEESLGFYDEAALSFSPLIRNNYATALARLGRYSEAVAEFEKVTVLAPELADAYNNWGQTLDLMGNQVGARARFEQALEYAPGHPAASRNLARLRAVD